MSACQSVLLYVVGWTLLLIARTVVNSQKQSTLVYTLCRKSSSFGNSRIVRRDSRAYLLRDSSQIGDSSRRRFELSSNLHRRGWILRWLLIDDGWSQWNWQDDAWTFLNNYLTYTVFFRLVNCVGRSVYFLFRFPLQTIGPVPELCAILGILNSSRTVGQ